MINFRLPSPCSNYFLSCIIIYFQLTGSLSFTNETDRQALQAIKNDVIQEDPFHPLSSWNESLHFCSWIGITCSLLHQRVTILNLSSLHLTGKLSPYIGNLTFLEEINLQDNIFRSKIPETVGNLFRLQYLRLANNSFQGTLPVNLTRLSSLQVLDIKGNQFEGNIPSEFSTFTNLRSLSFSRNNFTGNIPPSFGNLSSLRILSLSKNNLYGNVPLELGWLSNLQVLEMSSNKLSGMFPSQIYNISTIQTLSITNNQLTGTFPFNIGLTLPNIQLFLADLNGFSGPIPPSLGNASRLVKISIGDNELTGSVPMNLGNLQQLQVLHFGHNPLDKINDINFLSTLINCTSLIILSLSRIQIGGILPKSIGNLSSTLTRIWLDQNFISGIIPVEIGNLVSLSYLTIDTNMLTGNIPDSFGKLSNLQELDLFTNNLTGKIPFSIGNLTALNILDLQDNMLDGPIPDSLGNCSNLEGLALRKNHLSGFIPEKVIGIQSLSLGLILAENFLTGLLPNSLGNLTNLVTLDISENNLSGEIPSSLGNCLMLGSLQMQGNIFQGAIPLSLGLLKSIQVLDLSRNNLSGQIPRSFGKLSLLRKLNLSFNMLEGEVPNEGVFENISEFSVQNNGNLCGGIKQLMLHPCQDTTKKHRKLSANTIIILAITIPLFICLILAFFCAIFWRRRVREPQSPDATKESNHSKISYTELAQSTNEFSSENLIGEGKYGSVYKGFFSSTQKSVAIKVLKLEEPGADKSFLAECEALRNIRHRNLVKIITSCSSIDSDRRDFKALVYEFMPNGSLDSWLHPSISAQEEAKKLSLTQRVSIAIDVASALDYLHYDCGTPIVHCDIKPNNVLLDNDFCAHISDFGLARFLSTTQNANSSSIGIRGTIGYVPPEYGMGGEISAQGDVYSYGILLLELFTGKRPTDSMFTENYSLHNYVKMALPHEVMETIDLKMEFKEEDKMSSAKKGGKSNRGQIEECLESILLIGVSCCAEIPKERMNIKDVVKKLHTIRNVLQVFGWQKTATIEAAASNKAATTETEAESGSEAAAPGDPRRAPGEQRADSIGLL